MWWALCQPSCQPTFLQYFLPPTLTIFSTPSASTHAHTHLYTQGDVYMHLTNYAINKHSKDFVRDDDTGSKRRITTVNKWFEDNGYDVKKIWHDIEVRPPQSGFPSVLVALLPPFLFHPLLSHTPVLFPYSTLPSPIPLSSFLTRSSPLLSCTPRM